MKHIFFAALFLASNLSFAQGYGMMGGIRQVDTETLNLLKEVQGKLKTTQAPNVVRCGEAGGAKCEFTLLCDKLRPNRNADSLYKNAQGEVLTNIRLVYARGGIDQCLYSVSDQAAKDPTKILNEEMRGFALKKRTFLDSIEKNGEQTAYFAIEKAMVELALDETGNVALTYDSESFEKEILAAEEKAGVKLSEKSRKLWSEVNSPIVQKLKQATNQNPFFDPMLLSYPDVAGSKEKVLENQKNVQKELTRTYNIFLDTKKNIVAVLQKRKDGQNDAQVDNLIHRIETIKYMTPNSENLFAGTCQAPNAYYDPFQHEFTICPQMLQAPEATLQMIIAHELGHSIDPCIASYPLEKHVGKKKENPMANMLKDSLRSFQKKLDFVEFNPVIPQQSDEKYSSFNSELVRSTYSQDYEGLNSTTILSGIPLSKNPFSTVVDCLQKSKSVSARMGDIEGAKQNVLDNIRELKSSGADDSHPQIKSLKGTLGRLDSTYSEKKACGYMGADKGPSQMQEAFSDWVASEVIANKVEMANKDGNPEKAKQIAFEANGFFASINCESFNLDIADTLGNAMTRAGCNQRGVELVEDLTNMSRNNDPHPEGHARVSRVFMAHPSISQAIGCKQPIFGGAERCE